MSNFIGWSIVALTIAIVYLYVVEGDRPQIPTMPLIYLYENSLYTIHTLREAASIALLLIYGTVIALTLLMIGREDSIKSQPRIRYCDAKLIRGIESRYRSIQGIPS